MYTIGLYMAPKDSSQHTLDSHPTTRGIDYQGITGDVGASTSRAAPVAGFSGEAFGIGAMEENEEYSVYDTDSKSNYSSYLEEDNTACNVHITHKYNSTRDSYLKNFKSGKADKYLRKSYAPPVLPPGFKAWHNPPEPVVQVKVEARSVEERAAILGVKEFDRPAVVRAAVQAAVQAAAAMKQEPVAPQTPAAPQTPQPLSKFRPFKSNQAKEERYAVFQKGEKVDYSSTNLTEWEQEREGEEFTRSSRFFKPLSREMSNRFAAAGDNAAADEQKVLEQQAEKERGDAVRLKMFGRLTRETHQWVPANLLCRRFDVENPFPE